jgi:hypothetical protein
MCHAQVAKVPNGPGLDLDAYTAVLVHTKLQAIDEKGRSFLIVQI